MNHDLGRARTDRYSCRSSELSATSMAPSIHRSMILPGSLGAAAFLLDDLFRNPRGNSPGAKVRLAVHPDDNRRLSFGEGFEEYRELWAETVYPDDAVHGHHPSRIRYRIRS